MSGRPATALTVRGRPATALTERESLVLVLAVCVGVVLTTVGPRRDVDYFWHVMLGQGILDGSAEHLYWTSWIADPQWRTAQPLAEVALALVDSALSDLAPTAVRAVTASLALLALIAVTRPWCKTVRGYRWLAFVAGAAVIMGFTQERPAQVGMIGMPLAGAAVVWCLQPECPKDDQRYHPGLTVALSSTVVLGAVLWVGSHQSWLLAWVLLLGAVLISPRGARTRLAALGSLLAVLAIAWWWHGPPWRMTQTASAASDLVEWQPTDFTALPAMPAVILVLGFAVVLTKLPGQWLVPLRQSQKGSHVNPPGLGANGAREQPPLRLALGLGAALTILGVASASAWRHVPLTVLGAAPLLLAAATHLNASSDSRTESDDLQWRKTMSFATQSLLLLAMATAAALSWENLFPSAPTRADLVATMAKFHVCQISSPMTLATAYNDSGPALSGARRAPCAQSVFARVVIDGRADRYGAETIQRWEKVLTTQGGSWWADFLDTQANVALLPTGTPLVSFLLEEGWSLAQSCGGFVAVYHPDMQLGGVELACPVASPPTDRGRYPQATGIDVRR